MGMRGQFALNQSESQHSQQVAENSGVVLISRGQQSEPEPSQFPAPADLRRKFCTFRTMVKIWSIGIVLAVTLIIVLAILAESLTSAQQKLKPKVVIKRRKTVTTPPPTSTTTTTAPPFRRLDDDIQPQIRRSSELPLLVHPVTERGVPYGDSSVVNLGSVGPFQCPPCNHSECPAIAEPCVVGMVQDRCSCCHVCAVGEGTQCYNSSSDTVGPGEGICGPGLLCSARLDLGPEESAEALCECRNKQSICGSDNVTYSSECSLREAAQVKRNLTIASWTPCISAPRVTTPMENVTGAIGTDLSVSCEFRSFPAPIIYWEFSRDGSSARLVLPGDDSSVIQTHRGGPEEMMTTSWIQVVSASPKHQGTYYCVAKNSEGMTHSYATVSVYNELKLPNRSTTTT